MAPMVPALLKNSEQEMQKMSDNVIMPKMEIDSVLDMVPVAVTSIKERLSLKEIDEIDFDFDDVIENVDKLMCYYFKEQKQSIEKIISGLYLKYRSKIKNDYDRFMRIANKDKDFKDWFKMHNQFVEGKDEVANSILDLYFQMTMVPSYDVYDDVLIHAYLEDVQPYLN